MFAILQQERVKLYQKKIQKAESAAYVAANKSSTEINIAAANRFITHAIPELTAQQKQALKQVNLFNTCEAQLVLSTAREKLNAASMRPCSTVCRRHISACLDNHDATQNGIVEFHALYHPVMHGPLKLSG